MHHDFVMLLGATLRWMATGFKYPINHLVKGIEKSEPGWIDSELLTAIVGYSVVIVFVLIAFLIFRLIW